jgi:hypothetical protein
MRDAPISRGPALHHGRAPITALDTRACFEKREPDTGLGRLSTYIVTHLQG